MCVCMAMCASMVLSVYVYIYMYMKKKYVYIYICVCVCRVGDTHTPLYRPIAATGGGLESIRQGRRYRAEDDQQTTFINHRRRDECKVGVGHGGRCLGVPGKDHH